MCLKNFQSEILGVLMNLNNTRKTYNKKADFRFRVIVTPKHFKAEVGNFNNLVIGNNLSSSTN